LEAQGTEIATASKQVAAAMRVYACITSPYATSSSILLFRFASDVVLRMIATRCCSRVAVTTGGSMAQIAHACVQQVHGLVFPLFRRLVTAKLLLRPLLPSQCRVQPMRHIGMLLPFR
jgi:hypothetical protein